MSKAHIASRKPGPRIGTATAIAGAGCRRKTVTCHDDQRPASGTVMWLHGSAVLLVGTCAVGACRGAGGGEPPDVSYAPPDGKGDVAQVSAAPLPETCVE